MNRATRVVIVAATAVALACVVARSAAAATTDPLANWNTAPAGGCSFIQVATLACATEAPDAPITAHLAWRLAADSEVIPKPWLVPGFQTVALGVDAFVAGWEIGSALNAAFLHIDGVGLGNTATEGTGGTYIASPRWIYRAAGWDAFFGGAPAPAGWRLSGTLFSGGQSNGTFSLLQTVYPCSPGGDTAWTGVCNYDTAVANAFSRLNASSAEMLTKGVECARPGGPDRVDKAPGSTCTAPYTELLGPLVEWYIPQDSDAFAPDALPVPFSGQSVSVQSGWANPQTGAGVTTNAAPFGSTTDPANPCVTHVDTGSLDCSGAVPTEPYTVDPPLAAEGDPGFQDPATNWVRSAIDPNDFAGPIVSDDGADWETTGGPYVIAPDCYGENVAACEAAFDEAVHATGATFDAGFTEVPSSTYDSELPAGTVVGTNPASGALSKSDYFQLIVNEPQGTCYTKTAFPHPSERQPASGVLAKGYVMCNSSPQVATLTTYLFECSTRPSVKDYAPLHSDANCGEFTAGPTTVAVDESYKWKGKSLAHTNSSERPGYWYLAVTTSDNALPSVSELRAP